MRYFATLTLWLFGTGLAAFVGVPAETMEAQKLAVLATEFRNRLGISAKIEVAIVPDNQRLASVRPLATDSGTYLLEIDRTFLGGLTNEEKRAIVAHEMGHVWIFTHHPYLQTEPLANDKAELLVSKEALERRSEERRVGKECRSRWSP